MSKNVQRMKKAANQKGLEFVSAEWKDGDSINPSAGRWTCELRHNAATVLLSGKNVGEIIHKIKGLNTMVMPR